MPSVSETFGSGKTLKAADLPDEGTVLTIRDVTDKSFDDGAKLIVSFEETDQVLVSNLTNSRTIAGMYGDDTDGWIGGRITLYPTDTTFNGRTVPAIRVRSKPPKAVPARPSRPEPAGRPAAPQARQPLGRPVGRPAPPMTQQDVDAPYGDDDIPY